MPLFDDTNVSCPGTILSGVGLFLSYPETQNEILVKCKHYHFFILNFICIQHHHYTPLPTPRLPHNSMGFGYESILVVGLELSSLKGCFMSLLWLRCCGPCCLSPCLQPLSLTTFTDFSLNLLALYYFIWIWFTFFSFFLFSSHCPSLVGCTPLI